MSDEELIKKFVPYEIQEDALKKLNAGYPVQYIIGDVDFCGIRILVNENVLIPRFETEYLVEKTINYTKKLFMKKISILEIGTGSGCISIALKKQIDCEIEAIDISREALTTARQNANNNNIDITFNECDINEFSSNNKYDVIISNPPYVPITDKVDEKTKYEPQNAIFAKEGGLYFYKVILDKIKDNLNETYFIAFEIGDKEGQDIINIARTYLPNSYIKLEKDYNNYERYIFISNQKEIFN